MRNGRKGRCGAEWEMDGGGSSSEANIRVTAEEEHHITSGREGPVVFLSQMLGQAFHVFWFWLWKHWLRLGRVGREAG